EGNAGFIWTAGARRFTIGIALDGDEPNEIRPWILRQGTCADGGPSVGIPSDYPNLLIGPDGFGEVEALIDANVFPSNEYHIAVQQSVFEIQTVIACADLVLISS